MVSRMLEKLCMVILDIIAFFFPRWAFLVRTGWLSIAHNRWDYNSSIYAVNYCLSRGVDKEVAGSILNRLVEEGEVELVSIFLEHGVSPNSVGSFFWSYSGSSLEVTELLLKYGADPNRYSQLIHSCSILGSFKHDKFISEDRKRKKLNYTLLLFRYGADPFRLGEEGKVGVISYFIKNGIVDKDWIQGNLYRIPEKVWEKVYE